MSKNIYHKDVYSPTYAVCLGDLNGLPALWEESHGKVDRRSVEIYQDGASFQFPDTKDLWMVENGGWVHMAACGHHIEERRTVCDSCEVPGVHVDTTAGEIIIDGEVVAEVESPHILLMVSECGHLLECDECYKERTE